MQLCPNCGEENPDRFRICGICGTTLVEEAPPQEVRKTVSVVFCDLKGSTNLGEKLDPESLREVLNLYFRHMKGALERHGGLVEKYIGDAIMAVFGLPRVREDDALRAVRAAAEMQRELVTVNEMLRARWGIELQNRTGVNTGEVVASDGASTQRLVTGDVVNVAARLEQAAPAMEILIGHPTFRLVRDAVEVEEVEPLGLKGKSEPVPAYRLVGVSPDKRPARPADVPLVGRRSELAKLRDLFEDATQDRRVRPAVVFGAAGVGKSRLIEEFLSGTAEMTTVLSGRCLSYGEGITFWPLSEMIRKAAGIQDEDAAVVARKKLEGVLDDEDVRERIAAIMGLSLDNFPLQESFWAARSMFEAISNGHPTVLFFDDLHWAEQTLLDLVSYLVSSLDDRPLMILASARPELREEHPGWVEQLADHTSINLAPLDRRESYEVINHLLEDALPQELRDRIVDAAQGNPLFVQQMLSMLIDEGRIHRDESGRWQPRSDITDIDVPPTITALLTARLDLLPATERSAVERASVVGMSFPGAAIRHLLPTVDPTTLDSALAKLADRELLVGDEKTTFAGFESYRFTHILVRNAAYNGLLKRTRAALHEAFVDWVEESTSDRVIEYEEIRGYHLEQAYLTLQQLGVVDQHTKEVGERGFHYLSSAGSRAFARGDMHAAATLLHRAASLLDEAHPKRAEAMLAAGEAMAETGELLLADGLLQQASETADVVGDTVVAASSQLSLLQLRYATGSEEEHDEAGLLTQVETLVPHLQAVHDDRSLARAWQLITLVHWTGCRYGLAEEAVKRTIRHAEMAGDRVMEKRFLTSLAMCALYGPTPVPHAKQICDDILAKARGDHKAEALTISVQARLASMEGEFDLARSLYGRSREMLEDRGWNLHSALTSLVSGLVEVAAGELGAAEAELRRDIEALEKMGERNYISTTAAWLGQVLYLQGRTEESDRYTAMSESLAAPDDIASQFLWRCVRGKLLARDGDQDKGVALAQEGVKIICTSDDISLQAGAYQDLAETLALGGRHGDANEALDTAIRLFRTKGNITGEANAQALRSLQSAEGLL